MTSIAMAARRAMVLVRVGEGARLLDRTKPNWFRYIDVPSLSLSHCARCALGQVFGEYTDGLVVLWPDHDHNEVQRLAIAHGFTCDHALGIRIADQWVLLRDAWVTEVRRRMEAA